jgi:hypothetical protein
MRAHIQRVRPGRDPLDRRRPGPAFPPNNMRRTDLRGRRSTLTPFHVTRMPATPIRERSRATTLPTPIMSVSRAGRRALSMALSARFDSRRATISTRAVEHGHAARTREQPSSSAQRPGQIPAIIPLFVKAATAPPRVAAMPARAKTRPAPRSTRWPASSRSAVAIWARRTPRIGRGGRRFGPMRRGKVVPELGPGCRAQAWQRDALRDRMRTRDVRGATCAIAARASDARGETAALRDVTSRLPRSRRTASHERCAQAGSSLRGRDGGRSGSAL